MTIKGERVRELEPKRHLTALAAYARWRVATKLAGRGLKHPMYISITGESCKCQVDAQNHFWPCSWGPTAKVPRQRKALNYCKMGLFRANPWIFFRSMPFTLAKALLREKVRYTDTPQGASKHLMNSQDILILAKVADCCFANNQEAILYHSLTKLNTPLSLHMWIMFYANKNWDNFWLKDIPGHLLCGWWRWGTNLILLSSCLGCKHKLADFGH